MDKKKSIATLQAYATGLAAQSLQHKVESKIFADQGFSQLGEKYAEHAAEEMGWVDKFYAPTTEPKDIEKDINAML